MHTTSTHICYACHTSNAYKAQTIALTHQQNDTFYEEKHFLCQQCQNEFNTIAKYVRQNNLALGNTSLIGRNIIRFTQLINKHGNNEQSNQSQQSILIDEDYLNSKTEQQPFYQQQIKDIIHREKLHHTSILSNKIKYFVYCSSKEIPTVQRHQRVRNMILRLVVDLAISINQIENLSILVHVFLCFMNDYQTYEFMSCLWENFYNSDEVESGWNKLTSIIQCTKVQQQLKQFLNKNSAQSNKIQYKDSQKDNTKQLSHKTQSQALSESTPVTLTLKKSKKILNLDFSMQYSSDNSEVFQKQSYKQLHRMKNCCLLLMESIQEQQQKNREIIKQIEKKFKNQKEEYITTILALKQRVSELEITIREANLQRKFEQNNKNLVQLQMNGLNQEQCKQRSSKNSHQSPNGRVKMKTLQKLKKLHIKSFTENRSYNDHFKQTSKSFEDSIQNMQVKHFKPHIEIQDQLLTKIVHNEIQAEIDYVQKGLALLKKHINLEEIILKQSNKSSCQIQNLYQLLVQADHQIQRQQKKNRQSDSEIKRLLNIMKRKQERMVPLLHQKDQQIQTYENALWRLQNGMPMGDNKLANRIERILALISAKNNQNFNIMTKPKKKSKKSKKITSNKVDLKQQSVVKTEIQKSKIQMPKENKERCIIY